LARKKSAAGESSTRGKPAQTRARAIPKKETHGRKAPRNKSARKQAVNAGAVETRAQREQAGTKSFPVVGIGASAGGLEAFTELLKHLPLDTGLAFVLVQHLDPQHESALTQLLARATSLPVREVTNNLRVEANNVYIIPPNTTMSMARGVLKLRPRQQSRTPTRSIDSFLESLAQDPRERSIGVILSGTATDGTLGLEAIKAEGGITFAQDDSARYDSMPRSAVAAGCVDFVLSPEKIAKELARIAKHPFVAGQPVESLTPEDNRAFATAHADDETPRTGSKRARVEAEAAHVKAGENGYKKILLLLRKHSGVDFSLYKSPTVQRRITRRMVLNKNDTPEDYAQFLHGNAKELDALYSDVLISVTSFFRNPDAFDALKRKVFPKFHKQRGDDTFRVWVLGCSTGQEAYSIAMAFMECADKERRLRKLQVFATDLNDALLDKARHGLYAKSLAQDLSPQRLQRFFVEEEGGFRVVKSLREMVVFARQNLISDPPFSRMDLISCRNLLIYLEPSLQKKALPTFHYALKPEGFLFLGASESIGGFTDLFEPADKKLKIYSKKATPTPAFHLPVKRELGDRNSSGKTPRVPLPMGRAKEEAPQGFRGELNAQREADRITVTQFAPPGVLINAELQILQFRGPTSAYLEPPTGAASFDVLKMAREGLMLPLRAAINKAKKENKAARRENVQVAQNGNTGTVNIEVIPLKNLRDRCFLILFEDVERAGRTGRTAFSGEEQGSAIRTPGRKSKKEESLRITQLERELSETGDYLQSIQEQYEAANEELQASNEEVQSSNEELQSINEELETSKEELESTNEELTTVNEEMANRNVELNRLNADLNNLHASTKLPIVLLARDLTIRRFSAQAEKQFNLLATDIGRQITAIRHNLDLADLEVIIAEVIASVRESEHEVRDKAGRWYSLCVRPYMTLDNKVDGAVLILMDIDTLKQSEAAIRDSRDYAEAIIRTARDPLLILNADLRVHTANQAFYNLFKVGAAESEGRLIYDLGNRQWNIPRLRELLEDILPRDSFFNDFEVTLDFENIGARAMLLNARRLSATAGQPARILLGIQDITDLLYFQAELERSEQRFRRLFEATHDGVLIIDPTTHKILDANPFMTELLGYTPGELRGKELFEIGLLKDEEASRDAFRELQEKGFIRYEDLPLETKTGERREVEFVSNLYQEGAERIVQCNIRDITERKHTDVMVDSQREALQLLAEGVPLEDVLRFLIGVVERHSTEGMLAAITPLKEAGTHFERGIGASLPDAFNAAVEGVAVNSPTGLCAHAVRRREAVAVKDFNGDPAWQPVGEVVAPCGLRAGWSTPIISSSGQMLGTFTNYYCHVGDPTPRNRELVDIVVRTAAIAIERKRAEESLRASETRFRQLADAMPQIVWAARPDGYVDYYNERWYEFTGFRREEFGQASWEPILHPDDVEPCVETYFGCVREGVPYQIEYRFKDRFRGDYRWFMGRALPIRNEQGEVVRWFGTCTDIDDVKRAEEERGRLLNNEHEARQQAEAANRLKDEFLATVSHELRTPLNAILGWAELLIRGTLDEENAARGLETIARNARAQSQLISDLLDVSRIISGNLRFEAGAVDLIPIIDAAADTVRPAADAKGVELRLRLDPAAGLVSGDAARLQQIIWNLLTNAVKFESRNGHVEVQLKREDTSVVIVVTDTGEGISPEFLPHIFDRFRQAEGATARQHGGLGLGLAIVRHLVEAHGGTVRAASQGVGKGAIFTVTFPLIAVRGDRIEAEHKRSADHASSLILKGLQVLVVDDELDARELLSIALTQSSAKVRASATVREALEILDQWQPDVLVSDIGMPGEDGYELMRKVRAREPEHGGLVPALALTGYAGSEDAARAVAAGYQTHMAKPVVLSELVAAVASLAMKTRRR
jgi:two-component system CheB/CheR fusion protein